MSKADTIKARALEIVQDQASFVVDQAGLVDRTVAAAIHEHSGNYPAETAPVITSNGNRIQDLPAEYVERFSTVTKVVSPTIEEDGDPNGLDKRLWLVIRKAAKFMLMFVKGAPDSGKDYAVHLTIPHLASGFTLGDHEVEALAYLTSAHIAESMAARTAQGLEISIPAESVNFGDKPAVYGELGKQWRKVYKSIMTKGRVDADESSAPGVAVGKVTWDSPRRFKDRRLFGRTDA